MRPLAFKKSTALKTALIACVLSALAGCGAQLSDSPKNRDTRLQHPIQVIPEQVSVSIDIPAEGSSLSSQDQRRIRNFIRDFVGRGRSAVTVESRLGVRARRVLQSQGLRANEIIIIPDTTVKAPTAILTFTANAVVVPKCGNWSTSSTFTPTNSPHPDYGCSNRRNLGLIVADPGDLIEAQPVSGRGAARRDAVLDSYNAGDPIGPVGDSIDTQSVSGATE